MEYMKIEGFLGGAISKLINKGIESKFGYRPDISIDNLSLRTKEITTLNMKTNESTTEEDGIVVDLRLSMTQADFDKLIEEATK